MMAFLVWTLFALRRPSEEQCLLTGFLYDWKTTDARTDAGTSMLAQSGQNWVVLWWGQCSEGSNGDGFESTPYAA